ncbi:hypothetical protein LCGC14_1057580 [marine sediment metagenome]|uniref:Uncharacterized protein n=1 Tax=marine sediment metagenome TaxID=412755 RepID=A0A0F9N8Y2_9ZZZZ
MKKRPWYKVRRVWGIIFGITGAALASIPAAPVIVAVGVVSITTTTAAIVVGGIATTVFGYGMGAKVERKKVEED